MQRTIPFRLVERTPLNLRAEHREIVSDNQIDFGIVPRFGHRTMVIRSPELDQAGPAFPVWPGKTA